MSLTQPLKAMSLSIEFLRKLEKTIVAYEIEIAPIKINFASIYSSLILSRSLQESCNFNSLLPRVLQDSLQEQYIAFLRDCFKNF